MDAAPWFLASGRSDEADSLVRDFHYSKRPPGSVMAVLTAHDAGGLFGDLGEAWAAIYFSSPPTKWSEPVWELSRLVRREPKNSVPLTALIAASVRFLRQKRPIDLVVSFADSTQGHHGGIYQAASWNYDGQRDPAMDGCIVDGVFVPGRTCNARWGTRSPTLLTQRIGRPVEGHWDSGKHLYWKPIQRSGIRKAERLGLRSVAFPKPDAAKGAAA